MRAAGWVGRTVVLKLRYADFTTITRSRTIAEPTDLGRRIYEEVREIHDALGAHPPVRLIGVRMEQLVEAGIRGILNFAPVVLRLPNQVRLVNVDLTIQLEQLAFLIQSSGS